VGFANLILAREELRPVARAALERSRAAFAARGGTADEAILLDALGEAVEGRFSAAADRLDDGFRAKPTAFLPFKLSHALRFMLGDLKGMLAASDHMMAAWEPDMAGAGYLLGCHAFALEELGDYGRAFHVGRRAVALAPDDAWGMHAVAHIHEMRSDTRAGIAWLEAGRPHWSRCNNFSFHVAWHLALFHLERGDRETVLKVYDDEVRPRSTDDFRDVANAVSMLTRLRLAGVDVGDRWEELGTIAERRRGDTTLMFAALHTLLTLVARADRAGIAELVRNIESAAAGVGDQADVARLVAVPLARAIAWRERPADWSVLLANLPRIGGSNAQRDVFVLSLADVARRSGDEAALGLIVQARRRMKTADCLIAAVAGRVGPLPMTA
jgi:hypothetical protein